MPSTLISLSHTRSLTACRIQTLLCYASSSFYYLIYPTIMDLFFHTLPTYVLFFFLLSLTHSWPPGGLSWGLRNDCHYCSYLFFLSVLFLVPFLISPRHGPRIFVNPLLCFEKNLALDVAPFISFSLLVEKYNRWNFISFYTILLFFSFLAFGRFFFF